MKAVLVASILAAGVAGPAAAQEAAPGYTVLKADVRIQSSRHVTDIRRADADTFLLKAGANRWYKAEANTNCAKGVPEQDPVRLDVGPQGQIDVHSQIFLTGGRVCNIEKLDLIAPPVRARG
jgi:hypothetical protein